MLSTDSAAFEREMLNVAEVFDRRQPSAAALKHWFEALRDFRMDQVQGALKTWVRNRQKFPTINEILQLLADRAGRDAELRAKAEREREGKEVERTTRSEATDRMVQETLRSLRAMRDARPSRQWAKDIIAAHKAGTPLMYRDLATDELKPINGELITPYQLAAAQFALQGRMATDRTPGSDDE